MKYRVVVSAENSPYVAWQCKLLHYSCATRLGRLPLFVVHETGAPLHPDFLDIVRAGGELLRAPSYRRTGRGDDYAPRNTAGSLLHAAAACEGGEDEFLVLCDPDLIFTREPEFPAALSGAFYSYVNFDLDFVEEARLALGIPRADIEAEKERLRCGTPYVVPAGAAGALASAWLRALDAFPPRRWEDIMYAFGMAALMSGLRVELTHLAETNYRQLGRTDAPVLHYCYGDATWNKRRFLTEEQAPAVWDDAPEVERGSILGEILSQIREARDFYRKPW